LCLERTQPQIKEPFAMFAEVPTLEKELAEKLVGLELD